MADAAMINADTAHRGPRDDRDTNVPVMDIRNLTTSFPGDEGAVIVVDDVSLMVCEGETLAIVGESGSGKTMTFLSALGMVPRPGHVDGGTVLLAGRDISNLPADELRAVRGAQVSIVFQDPLSSLNPVFTIGDQIAEVLRAHQRISRRAARLKAIELLDHVQIPAPDNRLDDYPHQLSGGMRQRVLIAMAIALAPKVLIADEPTTALDVTVQAQVLDLLSSLQREIGMALVLITHDLGVVARHADRMAVMYAGRVVEQGHVSDVFDNARHPYTESLLRSVPRLSASTDMDLQPIGGQPPMPSARRPGCAFEPRCFMSKGRSECTRRRPELANMDLSSHQSACHFPDELRLMRR